jgi:hypothetical protein
MLGVWPMSTYRRQGLFSLASTFDFTHAGGVTYNKYIKYFK